MRTKPIIVVFLVVIAVAAAIAWFEYRKACCVEPPPETTVVPDDGSSADDGVRPEVTWSDDAPPAIEASPEGLYNDLKAASENAHEKPSLEIERVPPPDLPPPTRGEDDDPA